MTHEVKIYDELSGVDLKSLNFVLNEADITKLFTVSSKSFVTAILTVDEEFLSDTEKKNLLVDALKDGENEFKVFCLDNAGNVRIKQRKYRVDKNAITEELIGVAPFIIVEVVSGNGQKGLYGKPTDLNLKVRAVESKNKIPIPGILIEFEVTEGYGYFVGSNLVRTDKHGYAEIRFVFGKGKNKASAKVWNYKKCQPATFDLLEGLIPKMNYGGIMKLYEGLRKNTLPNSLEFKLFYEKDNVEVPLTGEEVYGVILDIQGRIVENPELYGYFVPSYAVTLPEKDLDGSKIAAECSYDGKRWN